MPYPWVLGDAHMVIALTNSGTAFEHEIAVAVPTPQPVPNSAIVPPRVAASAASSRPVSLRQKET